MTLPEAIKMAQSWARTMSTDPEIDSIAGEAAWRALYTFDAKKNVTIKWWVIQLTKQAIIRYWRQIKRLREREKFMDELWWETQLQSSDTETPIANDDWQLLVESFILKHPIDVIARDHNLSLHEARTRRKAAISRLEAVS